MRQKCDSMWAGPQHRIQHCWVRVSQMLWRCSLHLHSGNLGYSWVSRYLVWACQVKRPCIFLSLGIHLSTLSLHVSASRPVWPWRSKRIWGREWWEFFVNFVGVWSVRKQISLPLKTGDLGNQLQDAGGSTITYNMNGEESWDSIKQVVGCVEPACGHPQHSTASCRIFSLSPRGSTHCKNHHWLSISDFFRSCDKSLWPRATVRVCHGGLAWQHTEV